MENYRKPVYFVCKNNSTSNFPLYGIYLENWFIVGLANIMLSPVTFLINLMTLIALRKIIDENTLTNCIFTSLCTTDMLTGINRPIIIRYILLNSFLQQGILYSAFEYDCKWVFFVAVSFLTLLAIHVERYIAIFRPFTFEKIAADTDLIKRLILLSWAIVATLVTLCFFTPRFVMYTVISSILTPTAFIWSCYVQVKIVCQVHRITRSLRTTFPQTDDDKSERERYISRVKSRSNRIAGLILMAYMICYTPNIIIYIWRYFNPNSKLLLAVMAWTETLVFLNSIFNPLLFCMQKKDIRKTVLSLLRCRLENKTAGQVGS